jgi:hypothetical protein
MSNSNPASNAPLVMRVFSGLFFSVFLCGGLAILYFLILPELIMPLAQNFRAKAWPTVPCRIVSSELQIQRDGCGKPTSYREAISYLYQYEGCEYRGDRFQFLKVSTSERASKAAVVARYPAGSDASCFVDPRNPSEAVLDRSNGNAWLALFGLIPLVFVAVGGWGLSSAIRGDQSGDQPASQEEPTSPWMLRPDWAVGRSISSSKKLVKQMWVFAGLWNLFSLPFAAVFLSHGASSREAGPVAVAAIALLSGAGLLLFAIRLTLRWKRFGEAVFEMAQVPAALGGCLEGVIWPGRPIYLVGLATVRLACVSRRVNRNSGKRTSEDVLWQHEEAVAPCEGGAIPVLLRIPAQTRETTTLGEASGILWRLEVKARTQGGECEAKFEVPVFRVELTPEQEAKAQWIENQEQAELVAYAQPPNSRIRVRAAAGGGMEFCFPAGRHLGTTLPGPLFYLAIVSVMYWGMRQAHVPVVAQGILGLVGAALFYWLLYTLGGSKRVVIRPDSLEVTNALFGIGRSRRVPAEEVAKIKSVIGSKNETRVYFYSVKVVCATGKGIIVGTKIKEEREAEWLAAEMTNALGRG